MTSFSVYSPRWPQGKRLGQFLYWAGRSDENLGNREAAAKNYLEVCEVWKRSYYCHTAVERLTGLGEVPEEVTRTGADITKPLQVHSPAPELPSQPSKALAENLRYQAAQELMILGLYEEA